MTSKVLLAFVLSLSIVIAAIGQQPSPTPQPRQPESDQKPTAPEVDTQDVVKIYDQPGADRCGGHQGW